MRTSREMILERVRRALSDVRDLKGKGQHQIERRYEMKSNLTYAERIKLFAYQVKEYKARVSEVRESELAGAVADSCKRERVKKLVVPPGVEEHWLPSQADGPTLLRDGIRLLSYDELDQSDAVLTGCYSAVAQTGTIVLSGGKTQGRRVLTLLPDLHICVVYAEQIVGNIPEVFRGLHDLVKNTAPPITFISGPSATSDIEFTRVEGVHGPRRLEVLIVKG